MLQLYSNIKKLRKLHNMSQQELAEAVGYKGKSMIAQVENGRVDLSASMISKFAEVFHVSELELMGEDQPDNIEERLRDAYVRNSEAKEFVDLYLAADPMMQQAVLNFLKSAPRKP